MRVNQLSLFRHMLLEAMSAPLGISARIVANKEVKYMPK